MPGGEEVLRRTYEALGQQRDFAVLDELADPDFEMDLTERVLNPATYHGAEGLLRFLGESTLWASMDIDVERVIERGDEVLAVLLVTLTGRGAASRWRAGSRSGGRCATASCCAMKLYGDADAAVAEFG